MNILFILLSVLRVAFVGDPQVDDQRELAFARQTIYKELLGRKDMDFVIVMGDIVNENTELIGPSEAILDSLKCPWMRVHGNHDGEITLSDTTFVKGGVRYILMHGYAMRKDRRDIPDSISLKLLGSIEPVQKTVVCTHIPINDKLISSYGPDVLFVSAHLHIVLRYLLPGGAEQLGVGASCGSWWRGVPDAGGIPNALMNCGAPRGYFIADIDPDRPQWYRLDYKCIDRPASERASAHLRDGRLTVNVFGGSRNGLVQARLGGKWVDIPYEPVIAPEVQDIIDYNADVMTGEYRRAHRDEFIPMLRRKSPHTWCADAGKLRPGSRLKIRYSDGAMKFNVKLTVK